MAVDTSRIRNVLQSELGYSRTEVNLFMENFPVLHPSLEPIVEQWLEDRTIVDIEVEGLSLKDVMEKQQRHFLAVIVKFDALLDDTLSIEDRQRLHRFLKRQLWRR